MGNFPLLEDNRGNQPNFWQIDQDPYIIGLGDTAQLIIAATAISREHASIHKRDKGFLLQDLGSKNGTFINGVRLGKEAVPLKAGDQIVLGGEILLVYRDPNETSTGGAVGRLHGVWIDEFGREVWVDKKKIEPNLTVQQYALLKLLYSEPGRVFSREEIVSAVWPNIDPKGISEEAIDSVIKRLRGRLRENPQTQDYLQVVRGHGVKLLQKE